MDAITLLTQRQSCKKLTGPAPEGESLEKILTAGHRAPDHGGLIPWRFVLCQNEGLDKLSDLFLQAAINRGEPEKKQEKAKHAPYRAPLVIIVISKVQENRKVPDIEQHLAAGCALMSMQQAAQALGFGGIWRTGAPAFDPTIKSVLNLEERDQIVGFLYLGTPELDVPFKKHKPRDGVVSYL